MSVAVTSTSVCAPSGSREPRRNGGGGQGGRRRRRNSSGCCGGVWGAGGALWGLCRRSGRVRGPLVPEREDSLRGDAVDCLGEAPCLCLRPEAPLTAEYNEGRPRVRTFRIGS